MFMMEQCGQNLKTIKADTGHIIVYIYFMI